MEADSVGTTAVYTEYLLQYILLGTHDLSADARVNAFPNPAADRITLQWDANVHPVAVQVTDVTGRQVMSAVVKNLDRAEIPVSHLANGLYHYRLELENGAVKTGQFSVSH